LNILIFFFRQFIEATGYALFSVLLLHFSSLFHTKVSQKKCGQFRFFFTLLFNELKKKERKKQKKKNINYLIDGYLKGMDIMWVGFTCIFV